MTTDVSSSPKQDANFCLGIVRKTANKNDSNPPFSNPNLPYWRTIYPKRWSGLLERVPPLPSPSSVAEFSDDVEIAKVDATGLDFERARMEILR